MKYGYTVKKNGILYPAGTEVPADKEKKELSEYEQAVKAIKKMKKEELEAKADEMGVTFEEGDDVPKMKEKLIAALPSEEEGQNQQ